MNPSLTRKQSELLDQTLNLAKAYLRLEAEICEALREIDRTKLHKKLGHRSLFQYVTDRLGFTASVAYAFVSVTRKSAVIPALREAIEKKHLTVTKASRIVSSLTPENAASLIEFAGTHSCRETERKISLLNPKASRPDRVRPVAENLNEIQGTISDQVNEKLKRAESLMAQKGKGTDLNSVLEAALDEYLKHHDPVEKALRAIVRTEKLKEAKREATDKKATATANEAIKDQAKETANEMSGQKSNKKSATMPKANPSLLRTRKDQLFGRSSYSLQKTDYPETTSIREAERASINRTSTLKRVPLTAGQKHAVFHRDQGRCTHLDENGKRCGSDRWVDLHHIIEVSRGGTNEPSNLTLLCSFHHDRVHQLSLPIEGQFNWIREPSSRYS